MKANHSGNQIVRPHHVPLQGGLRQQAALSLSIPLRRISGVVGFGLVAVGALMMGAADAASVQDVAPAAGTPATQAAWKQSVEGSTFEIELVPFKSPSGGTLHVSTTEIPWELFDVFVYGSDKAEGKSNEKADAVTKPTKPYIGMDREFGHVGFPVISPSYLSCVQFCEWLSAKTGRTYRLPTGEEWKALCEQSGIDPKNCGDYAWVKENAGEKTHKIASKKADKLGCFDQHGRKTWIRGRWLLPRRDERSCLRRVPAM